MPCCNPQDGCWSRSEQRPTMKKNKAHRKARRIAAKRPRQPPKTSRRHRAGYDYDWFVTRHACNQWQARVSPAPTATRARSQILYAMETAQRIPNRLAARSWGRRNSKERERVTRYYFHPNAILIVGSKKHIVTVIKANLDDLATLLTWLATGHWIDETV